MGRQGLYVASLASILYIAAILGLIYFVKDIQIVYTALLPIGLFLESNKEKFIKISPFFPTIGCALLWLFAICLLCDLAYRILIAHVGFYTQLFMTFLAVGIYLFNYAIKHDE
jgi:hypothetical protein